MIKHYPSHGRYTSVYSFLALILIFSSQATYAQNQNFTQQVNQNYFIDFSSSVENQEIQSLILESLPQDTRVFHLFCHGRPGYLLLDGEWKSPKQIAYFLKSKIGNCQYLTIYGCDFAGGQKGKEAVDYISSHLRVTVSASEDKTGCKGDWNMEYGYSPEILSLEKCSFTFQSASSCGGKVTGFLTNDDFDGDGICNDKDNDDDNDGIPDIYEIPNNAAGCSDHFAPPSDRFILNPGSYILTETELLSISDADTTTEFSISNSIMHSIGRLNLALNAATNIYEIRIYNYLSGNVGNNATPHIDTIGQIALINGAGEVAWVSVPNLTPTSSSPGNSYYSILLPSPAIGIVGIEMQNIVGHSSGFGLRDIIAMGCDDDKDKDGFPNQYDTDSDADNCPDATESDGLAPSLGYKINMLDKRWMVNYPIGNDSTQNTYGVPGSKLANPIGTYDANVRGQECDPCYRYSTIYSDYDGDKVGDLCDWDSDNDGIPNIEECSSAGSYSPIPLSAIDMTNASVLQDTLIGDYIGPSIMVSGAAISPTGGCVDMRIDVEQLTRNGEFFSWDLSPTDGSKIFKGDSNSLYRFDISFYACNSSTPDTISTYFTLRDVDGDCDWNNDGIKDNSSCDTTVIAIKDEYMWTDLDNVIDFSFNAPSLMYTQEKGISRYFFSAGSDDKNSSAIANIGATSSSISSYIRFRPIDKLSLYYQTGSFGEVIMDFAYLNTRFCDYDIDGIPDYVDLDSDGDGCPDAYESSGNISYSSLFLNTDMYGGSTDVYDYLGREVDVNGIPYYISPNGYLKGSAIDGSTNRCFVTNPDTVAIRLDSFLRASVALNDSIVTSTARYGNVRSASANPDLSLPQMDSSGAYQFKCDSLGMYVFEVDVCQWVQNPPCPTETLVINVLEPLPLTLIDFELELQSSCAVQVKWTTSKEENIAYMDVMRRSVNDSTYKNIFRVNGNEIKENAIENKFSFMDNEFEKSKSGTYYYLLEIVDNDGSIVKTDPHRIELNCQGEQKLIIYPNPSSGRSTVFSNGFAPGDILTIRLLNSLGQLVLSPVEIQVNETGMIKYIWDSYNLENGIYQLIIQNTSQGNTMSASISLFQD